MRTHSWNSLPWYNYIGYIKKGEMGKACSSHGEINKCMQNSGRKLSKEVTTFEVAWDNMKVNVRGIDSEDIYLIEGAQDRSIG
jgi:hypothetical protein